MSFQLSSTAVQTLNSVLEAMAPGTSFSDEFAFMNSGSSFTNWALHAEEELDEANHHLMVGNEQRAAMLDLLKNLRSVVEGGNADVVSAVADLREQVGDKLDGILTEIARARGVDLQFSADGTVSLSGVLVSEAPALQFSDDLLGAANLEAATIGGEQVFGQIQSEFRVGIRDTQDDILGTVKGALNSVVEYSGFDRKTGDIVTAFDNVADAILEDGTVRESRQALRAVKSSLDLLTEAGHGDFVIAARQATKGGVTKAENYQIDTLAVRGSLAETGALVTHLNTFGTYHQTQTINLGGGLQIGGTGNGTIA